MRSTCLLFCLMPVLLMTGCSIFMPYESEFSCKGAIGGKCVSLEEAYSDSKLNTDGSVTIPETPDGVEKAESAAIEVKNSQDVSEENTHSTYKQALFQRLEGLIKEPNMPIVAPPLAMRVLLLPYKGDGNELYMLRHVYFFVDEPRWVLGDSVLAWEED